MTETTLYAARAEYADCDTTVGKVYPMMPPAGACAAHARKLLALVTLINGEGPSDFTALTEPLQEDVLALLGDLAEQVAALSELSAERQREAA